jgi:hypothetical protein
MSTMALAPMPLGAPTRKGVRVRPSSSAAYPAARNRLIDSSGGVVDPQEIGRELGKARESPPKESKSDRIRGCLFMTAMFHSGVQYAAKHVEGGPS